MQSSTSKVRRQPLGAAPRADSSRPSSTVQRAKRLLLLASHRRASARGWRAVEERVRRIYQDVEDAAVALRHELSVLLMRLPLQARPARGARGRPWRAAARPVTPPQEACRARLAPQVRKMPLVEFRSKYGSDVNAVLTQDIDARIAASKACSRVPGSLARLYFPH